jgi:predicted transposase YbfD/YdcC
MKDNASILGFFSGIKDHRLDRKKEHHLIDIIAITISSVICGAENWNEVEMYGKVREPWYRTFLKLPNGIPSHDTFNRFFAQLDPLAFETCFKQWVASLIDITQVSLVNIDGKTIRGSKGKEPKSAIHMVSAWASDNNIVLGQLKITDKSNEITAIPKLLEALFLANSLVSIDAMGCQRNIAAAILDKKADYLLAVKENQKELYRDIEDTFRFSKPVEVISDIDVGHGRVQTRKCTVVADLGHIQNSANWKGLKTLVKLESERYFKATDKKETSIRYYISSKADSADYFQRNIRSHWAIENKLHWMLDVVFHEDQSRKRAGNAAQNFSLINKIALTLLRNETSVKIGVKGRRLLAGWDNNFLLKILQF